jgi:hypothetical protein
VIFWFKEIWMQKRGARCGGVLKDLVLEKAMVCWSDGWRLQCGSITGILLLE